MPVLWLLPHGELFRKAQPGLLLLSHLGAKLHLESEQGSAFLVLLFAVKTRALGLLSALGGRVAEKEGP